MGLGSKRNLLQNLSLMSFGELVGLLQEMSWQSLVEITRSPCGKRTLKDSINKLEMFQKTINKLFLFPKYDEQMSFKLFEF